MDSLFSCCYTITSIDLSNFDISKVTTMNNLFNQCKNLEKINFGNINTFSVEIMSGMFQTCLKLTSVDLSKLDTRSVTSMAMMFLSCSNLLYLDLSSFDTSKVINIGNMFSGCSSLIYLNLSSFHLDSSINYLRQNPFNQINSNLKYCVIDETAKNAFNKGIGVLNCPDTCFQENSKIFIEQNICVDSCISTGYKYEYNWICYEECPSDTYILFQEENEVNENEVKECFDKEPDGYYFDINNNTYKKCFKNCKFCFGGGNGTNNNCKEWIDNFYFLNDSINQNNCYEKCEDFYYFDELNRYNCTKICPENYSKLIKEKNKCIETCEKDDTYKYEFNNTCYSICPDQTFDKENNYICQENKTLEDLSSYLSIITNINTNLNDNTKITDDNKNILITTVFNDVTEIKSEEEYKSDYDSLTSVLNDLVKNHNSNTDNQNRVLEKIEEIFNQKFDTSYIDKGNDFNFTLDNIIYKITSTSNQKNNENKDVSTIDLVLV